MGGSIRNSQKKLVLFMDGPLPITVVLTAGLERLPTVAAAPIRLPEAVNKGVDPLARPRP